MNESGDINKNIPGTASHDDDGRAPSEWAQIVVYIEAVRQF